MRNDTPAPDDKSPFHAGERTLQARVGKRDVMEMFGRNALRPFMPDQHRQFFAQLPFLVVGSVDDRGWPWASILSGRPGFLSSPDATTLQVNASALSGDPLGTAIRPGASLGLLGIELTTRRRNRMNGRVSETGAHGFAVTVEQSFGNCPQYIQARTVGFVREPGTEADKSERLTTLDDDARSTIGAADTFFVASYARPEDPNDTGGVDVSHRGGRPGFVKVADDTLTIPDFSGNSLFNTLGNLLVNPKAGLVFADFATGDLLMLTGTVEIIWEDAPEVRAFKGAERAWRFTMDHGLRIADALPFKTAFEDYAPTTLNTGDWDQAEATLGAEAKRDAWRPYRIAHIEDESTVIRSFILEPTDGDALVPFEAGQHLTIRVTPDGADRPVIRTYTTSSAPDDPHYRISVKREPDGLVSNHLHGALQPGNRIEAKAPRGAFFIDAAETRPAILLAGGVGVTPMISMAQHMVNEGIRTRHFRPLTVLHAARTTDQRAFAGDFQNLVRQSGGVIRYYSFIGQPAAGEKPGIDFNGAGRITADVLRQILALDDYDVFLCGPPPFMQAMYDAVRSLGVRDTRVFAEAFGPASLIRQPDKAAAPTTQVDEADKSIIKFTKSGFEQQWSEGGTTILETAEAHGLSPDFSCREGICGTCAVRLKSGTVAYRIEPQATRADDEILICCAIPAKGAETVEIDL